MGVQAYVFFNGECRKAVEYYAEVFGTEPPRIMTYGDAPRSEGVELREQDKDLVLHTYLDLNGGRVMFSDSGPGTSVTVGSNFSLVVGFADETGLRAAFAKLKVGATVHHEVQATFFSKCYGYLTDRFGIGWQLVIEEAGGQG
jgi:PhnB protein